jgi:hypothetical protein
VSAVGRYPLASAEYSHLIWMLLLSDQTARAESYYSQLDCRSESGAGGCQDGGEEEEAWFVPN